MSTNQINNQNHLYFMKLALNQASKVLGNTNTNPAVGCVITKNNSVVGVGHTSINGRPHAEINAIKSSKVNINKSNLYVTLEPCSHFGKTPPCVNTIIKKRIGKVFFSIKDLDPRSSDKCSKILKKHKIYVSSGLLKKEIKFFYSSYIKQKMSQLPFVTSKLALSKDFYTVDKKNKWITNEFSRGRVHLMRTQNNCILTSSSTIINDNPLLNCRIEGLESLSPTKIILDRELRVSINSRIFNQNKKGDVLLFFNKINHNKIKILKKKGIKTLKTPLNKDGSLDLLIILKKIKKLGFSRVFLESGLKLNKSFLDMKLINDLYIFFSNKNLKERGENSIRKYFKKFVKNKRKIKVKVNLFGDKLISYKLK